MNPFARFWAYLFGAKPMPAKPPETAPQPDNGATMAANLATEFEGFSAMPYQDSKGIWTYLYGTTRDPNGNPVTADTPAGTPALGVDLMMRDMTSAFNDIAQVVKVPLTDNKKAAILDLIYNIGAGAFSGSTLLRLLNAGQYGAAADQFAAWDHVGSVELAGLLRRRLAEKAMFQSGVET